MPVEDRLGQDPGDELLVTVDGGGGHCRDRRVRARVRRVAHSAPPCAVVQERRGGDLIQPKRRAVLAPSVEAVQRPQVRFVETERNWKVSVARYQSVYATALQRSTHG